MSTETFDCPIHTSPEQCQDDSAQDFRRDSHTGQCMRAGWVFQDSTYYIADEERAQALCQRIFGARIEEVFDEETEDVYYTEWDERRGRDDE